MQEETWQDIGIRRQEFIRALRLHSSEGEERLRSLVEAADVTDLEWLVRQIDSQFQNLRLHVKDEATREELLRDAADRRSWIGGVLAHKKTVEQRAERMQKFKFDRAMIIWIVIGTVFVILTFLFK